jgi:hypothetical protein
MGAARSTERKRSGRRAALRRPRLLEDDGFRHTEAINAGHAQIEAMGAAKNFRMVSSEDASRFTDAGLRDFEVVVFLNTDGNGILTAA